MAGSAVTQLDVKVKVSGLDKLPKLSSSLNRLSIDTVKAGTNTKELAVNLKEWEAKTVTSIRRNQQLSAAWKELAASVQFGSNRFREATAEARRLDAQLAKMETRTGGGTGGRMGRLARTAGAIAGAGVFGGPEGAIGAAVGAFSGPLGAAVGGAIGAQVGMVRQAIGSTADYSAALARQRKALKLVIGNTNEYARAQEFLGDKSKKLAIPQDVIVRQFTALTASVKGAGHSVEDAQKVFEAIASGIRGTGGSLEDMRAAMVATAQVFSKGKVSAEELRQQLGERLPGAFTIFAESMGKTPAELDKALEQGKVTLADFMKFSEVLFEKYGENAEILAAGPEAAGDRFATAMSEYKDELGKMLQPTGAAFQDWAAGIIEEITKVQRALNELFGIGDENQLKNLERELSFWRWILEGTEEIHQGMTLGGLTRGLSGTAGYEGTKGIVINLEQRIAALKAKIAETADETNNLNDATSNLNTIGVNVWENMQAGATSYLDSIKSLAERIQKAVTNAFKGMEDALVDFVMTGKLNFSDLARSIIKDMARIAVQQAITAPFSAMMGNLFTKNAKGNIYAQNGIVPFAKGGIVNSPHIFPFKNGVGLLGEQGPEAIMPLRRGPSGRLGVEAHGGMSNNIIVNVDAAGTDVEGSAAEGRELGKLIGAAVQAELIKQRRPGGILG